MQIDDITLRQSGETKAISDQAAMLILRGGEYQARSSGVRTEAISLTVHSSTPEDLIDLALAKVGYRVIYTDRDEVVYDAILQSLTVSHDRDTSIVVDLAILGLLGYLLLEEGGYLLLEEGGRIIL